LPTYALQRYDERKLAEALAALKTARDLADATPLYPWLELWRAEACAEGAGGAEVFRALLAPCGVGKPVDLLDRTPAELAGAQADQDLRAAFLGLELGAGLEPWMREGGEDLDCEAFETILGALSSADVRRLSARIQHLAAGALFLEVEELETYASAWERCQRVFAVAAEREEGLALLKKA
jgi:hypothetical protein